MAIAEECLNFNPTIMSTLLILHNVIQLKGYKGGINKSSFTSFYSKMFKIISTFFFLFFVFCAEYKELKKKTPPYRTLLRMKTN